MPLPPAIVTFTTDFGSRDHYAAAMKAAVLRHCPDATLVDITHHVPRQDILAGSITLERAISSFGPGTIHLAVVDPGVGTRRRLLIARIAGQLLVCPDNGLMTWAWRRWEPRAVHELLWRPAEYSATFHGRDIMAPAAGKLAAGETLAALTQPMVEPILLPLAPAANLSQAVVIYIDHFGNAITNVEAELVEGAGCSVLVDDLNIGPIRHTYADVEPGQPLALISSGGLLELAVRDGSAAEALALKVGSKVRFS